METAIIGYGKAGRLYAQCFEKMGHTVRIIDSNQTEYSSLTHFLSSPVDLPEYWVVSSPTSQHLIHLSEILKADPHARVFLEKPAVAKGELSSLQNLLSQYPNAKICINDVYGLSPIVQEWSKKIEEKKLISSLCRISIELSKNRTLDEQNGRFIDTEFGVFGYEGFHLLSILRSALGNGGKIRQLLSKADTEFNSDDLLIRVQSDNSLEIELASSIRGNILLPDSLVQNCYPSSQAAEFAKNQEIPSTSNFRYRYAKASFEDGSTLTLIFEPLYEVNGVDWKNRHLIVEKNINGLTHHWIHQNQFYLAVQVQTERMASSSLALKNKIELLTSIDLQTALEALSAEPVLKEVKYAD